MLPDSVAAKRKHLKTREGGRFDPDAVARRLDALRAEAGVEPKEIGPRHLAESEGRERDARMVEARELKGQGLRPRRDRGSLRFFDTESAKKGSDRRPLPPWLPVYRPLGG
jgi:hypothetical protein